jgi:hypothetical protein
LKEFPRAEAGQGKENRCACCREKQQCMIFQSCS